MGDEFGSLPPQVRGFGLAADAYERGRPGYPAAAMDHLAAALDLGRSRRVADVAAGTGKLSRALAARTGWVVAVEPVAEMRQILQAAVPDVAVVAGRAEALPLAPASVDAVTVAQAFHWFDGPHALEEFWRVLRPDRQLAVVWNERDERTDLQADLERLFAPHRGAAPRYRGGAWRQVLTDSPRFGRLRSASFPWSVPVDRDRLLDRVRSTSFIATLPTAARHRVVAQAGEVFEQHAVGGDTVDLAYVTWVHVLRRQA